MKKAERKTEAVAVGARLVKAREALGITQAELARRMGVEVGNLSNWENGYAMLPAKYVAKIRLLTRIDSNYLYQNDLSGLPGDLQDAILNPKAKKLPKRRGKRS